MQIISIRHAYEYYEIPQPPASSNGIVLKFEAKEVAS